MQLYPLIIDFWAILGGKNKKEKFFFTFLGCSLKAQNLPRDTIVLEKLTNIKQRCGQKGNARKKHRGKMGRWSFKRLENAIKNYAELGGIYIEYVEPHYTSQMCSKCGVILKSNRKSQSFYSCSCGLKLNADLNASRNISTKWRMANGNALGLSVNQPIVADYN